MSRKLILSCIILLNFISGPVLALKTVSIPESVTFCEEEIPLNTSDVRERLMTQLLIFANKEVQVTLWYQRHHRFFPVIEDILKKRKLPEDLKYICVIESSLMPKARSSSNAYGPWQFLAPSARENGLTVKDNIDERLHLEKATEAALDYLENMKKEFGSWTTAMAGYNAGHNRIKNEIYRQGTSSYFELELPDETERYVFNAIATKLIFENPARYGFDFSSIEPFPVDQKIKTALTLRNFVPVKILAWAANLPFRDFSRYNPWIRGVNLKQGSYVINIPPDQETEFHSRIDSYLKNIKGYISLRGGVKVTVEGKNAGMRVGPGNEYPVFRKLKKGDKFRVKGRTGHRINNHYWYIFKMKDGSSGWISGGELIKH